MVSLFKIVSIVENAGGMRFLTAVRQKEFSLSILRLLDLLFFHILCILKIKKTLRSRGGKSSLA